MNLSRMEKLALDLAKHKPKSIEAERAAVSFEQTWHHFNDPEIAAAYEIAKRYEDNTEQKIKAYAGGWPQLVNWQTTGPGTSTGTFTTLQAITPTQTPNIAANTANTGAIFHLTAFGIYGSASTAPTMQAGIGLNGAAPTSWVSALTTVQASQTIQTWQLQFWCIVTASGSSGTIQGSGNITNLASANATVMIPATQATALTWNTTQANYFNLGAGMGTSSASNLIQVNGFLVLQNN